MNDDSDLIGKVTRWGLIKLDGKDAEIVRYLITEMDADGRLEGACTNDGPRLHGRIRKELDPDRVRRGLTAEVISLEDASAKYARAAKT